MLRPLFLRRSSPAAAVAVPAGDRRYVVSTRLRSGRAARRNTCPWYRPSDAPLEIVGPALTPDILRRNASSVTNGRCAGEFPRRRPAPSAAHVRSSIRNRSRAPARGGVRGAPNWSISASLILRRDLRLARSWHPESVDALVGAQRGDRFSLDMISVEKKLNIKKNISIMNILPNLLLNSFYI